MDNFNQYLAKRERLHDPQRLQAAKMSEQHIYDDESLLHPLFPTLVKLTRAQAALELSWVKRSRAKSEKQESACSSNKTEGATFVALPCGNRL